MATEIFPQSAQAAAADALSNAYNDVNAELTYIQHLADAIFDVTGACAYDNGTKIEALVLSIRRMAESVSNRLEQHFDSAVEAARNQHDRGLEEAANG